MSNVLLKLQNSDLASRSSAVRERYNLVSAVQQGQQVVVDLSEVLSISESYADELFGVLAAHYGLEWITWNVALIDVADTVLEVIATVIDRRLVEANNEQPVLKIA